MHMLLSTSDSDRGEISADPRPLAKGPVVQGETGTGVPHPFPHHNPLQAPKGYVITNVCGWWCPLRELTVDEVEDEEEREGATMDRGIGKPPPPPLVAVDGSEHPVGSSARGGRPPNVKPAPKGVVGCWCCWRDAARLFDLQLIFGPAEEMSVTGAWLASCIPSSAIAEWGIDPGRGKKTERLRE